MANPNNDVGVVSIYIFNEKICKLLYSNSHEQAIKNVRTVGHNTVVISISTRNYKDVKFKTSNDLTEYHLPDINKQIRGGDHYRCDGHLAILTIIKNILTEKEKINFIEEKIKILKNRNDDYNNKTGFTESVEFDPNEIFDTLNTQINNNTPPIDKKIVPNNKKKTNYTHPLIEIKKIADDYLKRGDIYRYNNVSMIYVAGSFAIYGISKYIYG
jgi:hypothetical protein